MPEVERSAPLASTSARGVLPPPAPREDDLVLEGEIDLGYYYRVFGRHWNWILVGALLGALVGLGVSLRRPTLYEAVTTLVVLPPARRDVQQAIPDMRPVLENYSLAAQVIADNKLDRPPYALTPQAFVQNVLQIEEVRATNFVRVGVRLGDPNLAATASRGIAERAVVLARDLSEQAGSSTRDQLKNHVDDAMNRLQAAEQSLLAYRSQAQVELLKNDADAALDQRRDLLRLVVDIEAERARIKAAENEISKQPRLLSSPRAVGAEDALRRSTSKEDLEGPGKLDLSNPLVNPVYQTLEFEIATSRARLASLEQERHEMMDVQKIGGPELKQLTELYRRQIELERLQTNYDVAKRVYSDLSLQYEQAGTDAVGATPRLQVVDKAVPPDRALSRRIAQTTLLGLCGGLVLAALAALVFESRHSRTA